MTTPEQEVINLAEQNFLVVGLARSGTAAANFLAARGASVTATDLKSDSQLTETLRKLSVQVKLRLGEHCLDDFLAADRIILSPGVPRSIPELQQAAARGVEIISEVELAYRYLKGRFIGVTGSNGKTTTTALIGAILKEAGMPYIVAGNIGTPLTSFIDDSRINRRETIFVVELSSFQLETIVELRCEIGLLLNVTPDHMDRYPDFNAYKKAKSRIFLNQTKEDIAVVNGDDTHSLSIGKHVRSRLLPFSSTKTLRKGAYLEKDEIILNWDANQTVLSSTQDIRIKGKHNLENTLAAASTTFLLGVSPASIREAVRKFAGVEHRLEWIRCLDGVEYYNDSKATNVDAAIRAIQAFETPLVLIMGGLDKGTDFSPLKKVVSERIVKIILLGKAAEKLSSVLSGLVKLDKAAHLEEAVKKAQQSASPGAVVLLAPACASFDMFQDYEERGRVFKTLVDSLISSESGTGHL